MTNREFALNGWGNRC